MINKPVYILGVVILFKYALKFTFKVFLGNGGFELVVTDWVVPSFHIQDILGSVSILDD
jgi:hypothetical protein